MARRDPAGDPRLLKRIARYQEQGLPANVALAREKKAGRGMRRQAWLALYRDTRGRELSSGPPPQTVWAVKQPRGWIAFVVVLSTPRDRSNVIEERVIMVGPSKRKPSERKAIRQALAAFDRSRRRYPSRVVGAYVSSIAQTVKRED